MFPKDGICHLHVYVFLVCESKNSVFYGVILTVHLQIRITERNRWSTGQTEVSKVGTRRSKGGCSQTLGIWTGEKTGNFSY